MVKGIRSICFLIVLGLFSCKYESDEVFAPEIKDPSDSPPFKISINLPDAESFNLTLMDYVVIRVDSGNVKIKDITFSIDTLTSGGFKSGNDYYLPLFQTDYNQHTLSVRVITSAGSSSMADELGLEGFVFDTRKWTYGFSKFDVKANASSSHIPEGALIKWKNVWSLTPIRFIIERPESGLQFITDSLQYIDTNYIGEIAEYDIYASFLYGGKQLWATHKTLSQLPKLKYDFVNTRTALTWEPSLYKDKIKEYRLYSSDGYNVKLLATVPGNQNYFIPEDYMECILGKPTQLVVEAVPNNPSGIDPSKYKVSTDLKYGVPHKFFDKVVASSSKGVFRTDGAHLRYHNTVTGTVTVLMQVGAAPITISPDFKTLVLHANSTTHRVYNLGDLHSEGKFQLVKTVSLGYNSPFTDVTYDLSDNGILVTYRNDSIRVFDVNLEREIGKYKGTIHDRFIISPDGTKLLLLQSGKQVHYNIHDGTIQWVSTLPMGNDVMTSYNLGQLCQIPGNQEMFYFYSDYNEYIEFRRYDDLSIVNRYQSGCRKLVSIDELQNRYMTCGYDYTTGKFLMYVNDISTGEVLFKILKDKENYGVELNSFLSNNTVYTDGFMYILPN